MPFLYKLNFFLYKYVPLFYSIYMNYIIKILFLFIKKRRQIAKANLDYIYGDSLSSKQKNNIIFKSFYNYTFAIRHFIENRFITKDKLSTKITCINKSIVDDIYKKGRKIIFSSGHFGHAELLVLYLNAFCDKDMVGIAQYTKSTFLNYIMKEVREKFGSIWLERNNALRYIIKNVKNINTIMMLLDQKTNPKSGNKVSFLGKGTYYLNTASMLARKYNFVIIPVYINTEDDDNHIITFYDAIYSDKTKNTKQDYQDTCEKQSIALEENIKKRPHLWHWLHKKWEFDNKGMYDEI